MGKEQILSAEHAGVGYEKKILVQDMSFVIREGEIWTLMGPNGAGKSTILKTITAQIKGLEGTITVLERDLNAIANKLLATHISMLTTKRVSTEYMTCREVVEMGRYPYLGMLGILGEKDSEKVHEALETVDALSLAEQDFMTLSDGQKQRILLARALCQEPKLLVLDEPTSYLDLHYKMELLEIIKNLALRKNMAVLMSMHELELIQKVADFCICIKDGRVVQIGTVKEVYQGQKMETLYDLAAGSFEERFCLTQLTSVRETPKVFVIGGGGSAILVYYELQRKGISFATGILHENDCDYVVAKALAAECVVEKAFYPIGEEAYKRAQTLLCSCEEVIVTVKDFGPGNEKVRELIQLAEKEGKIKHV